jgi:small subunit ribosomal protein S7
MPRKGPATKREILPDPKHRDLAVTKFINMMMQDGKKGVAERILYGAMDLIQQRSGQNSLEIFKQALEHVKPIVEVRSRRVGGATYQVPVEVRPTRRNSLAMRWIVQSARQRPEKGMREKLAGELFEASQNRGGAVKKRDDTHRMAEANKAFAHYRW